MRTAPSWFQLCDYDICHTFNTKDWFIALQARREAKALFELLRKDPDVLTFTDSDNKNQQLWQLFQDKLANNLAPNQFSEVVKLTGTPKRIQNYTEFRILPLFDVWHWHEINNLSTPTLEELRDWLFPDIDKKTRYIVSDAQKVLKKALMECDVLQY